MKMEYGYYDFQNPPYMASRQMLITRIVGAGNVFSFLPCEAWHGYMVTNAHRVEVEVGADGHTAALPSEAATGGRPESITLLAISSDDTSSEWRACTIIDWSHETRCAIGVATTPPSAQLIELDIAQQRNGVASAATCIGAPVTKNRFMGGRSKTINGATGKYIDLGMSASLGIWLFFGRLVATAPV
jgi:hypothetical protein